MFLRSLSLALRLSPRRVITQITAKNTTAAEEVTNERDPAPYFFDKEIQKLLRIVTRPETEKIFRRRLDGQKLEEPKYEFMTNEQLEKAMEKAQKKMEKLLQMPPVVKVRKEEGRILSKDPALQGFTQAKIVYTDISFGLSNKNRMIAVREPNGILRTALHAERDRLNQIYFPLLGREIQQPKMFEPEYLEAILKRGDYEFVLDRACLQFDPDHPEFQRVAHTTYNHIDKHLNYYKLRSTRHYGPLIFYLAWNNKLDNLLFENIKTERIEDAAIAIQLYYKLNPSKEAIPGEDDIKIIEDYIKTEAGDKQKLNNALKVYLKIQEEKDNIKKHLYGTDNTIENPKDEIKT